MLAICISSLIWLFLSSAHLPNSFLFLTDLWELHYGYNQYPCVLLLLPMVRPRCLWHMCNQPSGGKQGGVLGCVIASASFLLTNFLSFVLKVYSFWGGVRERGGGRRERERARERERERVSRGEADGES